MEQRTLTIKDIELSYVEKNPGVDKTIFFIHGNSLSSRLWHKQFSAELFSGYRLVAFDLPAHGRSGVAANLSKDYSVAGLGNIIAGAVKQLSNNLPYVLVGLSLGTNVVAEMLADDILPAGIVLAASCIVGGDITADKIGKEGADLSAAYMDNADPVVLEVYFNALCTSREAADLQMIKEDYQSVRPPFRSALLSSIVAGDYNNEIKLLQITGKPILLVFGRDEQLLDTTYLNKSGLLLWKDSIFTLPGAGHLVNIDQPVAFNNLLVDYINSCL